MRTIWGTISKPLRTTNHDFHQNAKRSQRSIYLQHYTFRDKSSLWYDCYIYHFPRDACTTRCWWIFLYFIIYDRGTHFQFPRYITIGAKERVKWGPFQQFGPNNLQVLNWGLKCWVRIFNFLQSVTWETPSRHTGLALIWRILRPEEWRPANNRSLQGPGSLNRDPLGCSIFCIRNHISSSN